MPKGGKGASQTHFRSHMNPSVKKKQTTFVHFHGDHWLFLRSHKMGLPTPGHLHANGCFWRIHRQEPKCDLPDSNFSRSAMDFSMKIGFIHAAHPSNSQPSALTRCPRVFRPDLSTGLSVVLQPLGQSNFIERNVLSALLISVLSLPVQRNSDKCLNSKALVKFATCCHSCVVLPILCY